VFHGIQNAVPEINFRVLLTIEYKFSNCKSKLKIKSEFTAAVRYGSNGASFEFYGLKRRFSGGCGV
jgi:hypothetical protein